MPLRALVGGLCLAVVGCHSVGADTRPEPKVALPAAPKPVQPVKPSKPEPEPRSRGELAFDELLGAQALSCVFSLSVNANWDYGTPKVETKDDSMAFSFDAIDHSQKHHARMIGNQSAVDVIAFVSDMGLTFVEHTPGGSVMTTTVFAWYPAHLSLDGAAAAAASQHTFAAVHSRHLSMLGPIPSQRYGSCKIL